VVTSGEFSLFIKKVGSILVQVFWSYTCRNRKVESYDFIVVNYLIQEKSKHEHKSRILVVPITASGPQGEQPNIDRKM